MHRKAAYETAPNKSVGLGKYVNKIQELMGGVLQRPMEEPLRSIFVHYPHFLGHAVH